MAFKLAEDVRNARCNAIASTIGASAVLKLRSGAPPTNITDPDSGTVIATMNLPVTWMAAASGGAIAKTGTWEDLQADAGGTVGHFRIYASDGVTQKAQGTVTITGGGGDMTLDNNVVAINQKITISTFGLTDPN